MLSAMKRLLVLVALLLAGCAGPKYMYTASSIPPLQPGQGRIFFYTPNDATNEGNQPKIRVNRDVVGRLKPGSFFYVDRPAGNYVVTTKMWTGDGLSFVLDAGETRYVRYAGAMMGSSGFGRPEASLVYPASQAQTELLPLQYWGAAQ